MMRESRLPKKIQNAIFIAFVDDKTAVQATIDIGRQYYKKDPRDWKTGRDGAYVWSWHESFYKNVLRHYRHFREQIMLSTQRQYPAMSGEVEIDLTFFGGHEVSRRTERSDAVRLIKGKSSRLTGRGKKKKTVFQRPVLGILQRGGKIILLPMQSRARAFLELMICQIVAKGSVVYTDGEKGLNELKMIGYRHRPVILENNFVSKEGWHINNIESFFREMKGHMRKQFKGVPKHTIDMHIKEREFRYNHRDDLEEALRSLLK